MIVVRKTKEKRKGKEISTKLSRSFIPFNRSKRNALMDDRMLTKERDVFSFFIFNANKETKSKKRKVPQKKNPVIKNKY